MKHTFLVILVMLLRSCVAQQPQLTITPSESEIPISSTTPQANLPNPASVYCEQQGYNSEIRSASDGSQSGVCIFPDGSECDEWAYFRGECAPVSQGKPSVAETTEVATAAVSAEIPTPRPIDPAEYQGWWSYTHPVYGFSIMLPEDWVVDETTASDPVMNDHTLNLHPKEIAPGISVDKANIRMTFRKVGEDVRLWPTGVGEGEFIPQGTLEIAYQPAQRLLLVCPSGEVTSIWYHKAEGQPNIRRGDLEFGFIFSATPSHCEPGYSLSGKAQHVGEMIIASLKAP
jgi:putative hemolysin